MEEVLSILPAERIRVLVMDREFTGESWLAWLRLMDVRYIVRLKRNALVDGEPAGFLCERNRWKRRAAGLVEVFGQQVRFAAKRLHDKSDPWLAVISYGFSGEEALALYRKRWGIETLFGHLKEKSHQMACRPASAQLRHLSARKHSERRGSCT